MTRLLLTLTIILATLVNAPAFAQANTGTLLIANRQDGSISMIDLQTKSEVARLPIGQIVPHEMAASPNGRWAVTSEYGTGNNPGRHLLVIDIAAGEFVSRIDLGPDSRPHSMVFLSDSRHLVVTLENSSQLALVDIINETIVHSYPTGGGDSHMVRLAPDNSRAYVASRGSGTLSVITLFEDRPPTVIPTGARAEGIAVSPDGNQIWVANQGDNNITVVDANTLQVSTTITGITTNRVEFLPNGQAVVPGGLNTGNAGRYITFFDSDTREVVRSLQLPDTDAGGTGVRLLAANDALFLSDSGISEISVLVPDAGTPPQHIINNNDNPDGMAWSPVRMNILQD